MSNEVFEYVFKISIIGSFASGKTSLINKFVDRSFSQDYKPTLGASIIAKDVDTVHKGAKILARLVFGILPVKKNMIQSVHTPRLHRWYLRLRYHKTANFEDIKDKWHKFQGICNEKRKIRLNRQQNRFRRNEKVSTEQGMELAKR